MIHLAICEDNSIDTDLLLDLLIPYQNRMDWLSYTSSENLEQALEAGAPIPQIVIMDIQLPGRNGLKAAELLNIRYPQMQFIFITNYNQRYSQYLFLHNFRIIGYLVKPLQTNLLYYHLDHAIEMIDAYNEECLHISGKTSVISIPYVNILWVESQGHYLHIRDGSKKQRFKGKLNDIESLFPDSFLRIHKSYLINMDYVRELSAEAIVMRDGTTLPISRSHLSNVRQCYYTYRGLSL